MLEDFGCVLEWTATLTGTTRVCPIVAGKTLVCTQSYSMSFYLFDASDDESYWPSATALCTDKGNTVGITTYGVGTLSCTFAGTTSPVAAGELLPDGTFVANFNE